MRAKASPGVPQSEFPRLGLELQRSTSNCTKPRSRQSPEQAVAAVQRRWCGRTLPPPGHPRM
eukprot:7785975-Alexandrium_andersonii.AAC.1